MALECVISSGFAFRGLDKAVSCFRKRIAASLLYVRNDLSFVSSQTGRSCLHGFQFAVHKALHARDARRAQPILHHCCCILQYAYSTT